MQKAPLTLQVEQRKPSPLKLQHSSLACENLDQGPNLRPPNDRLAAGGSCPFPGKAV
ncbi:hypothetical protein P7K49_030013, partial [Saguinus oedipus]